MIFPAHAWTPVLARSAVVALVATGALVGPFPAEAQDPLGAQELAERRQRCLQVAAHLAEQPDPGPDPWTAAFSVWPRCPDVGPDFLARMWLAPPGEFFDNPVVQRYAAERSVTVLDERIFTAVLEVLADRSRPKELRIGALSVAAGYADPTHFPRFTGMLLRTGATADEMLMDYGPSGSFHRILEGRIQGTQPLLGDPEERLLGLLNDIMDRADEDPYVVGAVRGLLVWHYKIP